METRTVTQFHFLTWGELNNPPSAKVLLDFRRYVSPALFLAVSYADHRAALVYVIKTNEQALLVIKLTSGVFRG